MLDNIVTNFSQLVCDKNQNDNITTLKVFFMDAGYWQSGISLDRVSMGAIYTGGIGENQEIWTTKS